MLADIPFNDDMDLLLPSEYEWLNKRWEFVVGADINDIHDEALAEKFNLAKNAFKELIDKPHRRNMKQWYLKSAEMGMKSELLDVTLKQLGNGKGVELLQDVVESELMVFFYAPGVWNESFDVNTFTREIDSVVDKLNAGGKDLIKAYSQLAPAFEQLEGLRTESDAPYWKAHWVRAKSNIDLLKPSDVTRMATFLSDSLSEKESRDMVLDMELPDKLELGDTETLIVKPYSSQIDFASEFFETPEPQNEEVNPESTNEYTYKIA